MKDILVSAVSHLSDSKTLIWLVFAALLALIAVIIAQAAFHQSYWADLLNLLGLQSGTAGVRAAVVDGVPKIVASNKDPSSAGANPTAAVSSRLSSAPVTSSSGTDIASLYAGQGEGS